MGLQKTPVRIVYLSCYDQQQYRVRAARLSTDAARTAGNSDDLRYGTFGSLKISQMSPVPLKASNSDKNQRPTKLRAPPELPDQRQQ